MTVEPKDILLVGLGAVGTICECLPINISHRVMRSILTTASFLTDAYVLQRKGLARVTVVARSNYDAVKGEQCYHQR